MGNRTRAAGQWLVIGGVVVAILCVGFGTGVAYVTIRIQNACAEQCGSPAAWAGGFVCECAEPQSWGRP